MKNRVLPVLLIFLGVVLPAAAQEKEIYNLPPWLILEYGRKAYADREYGVALRYAREALEKQGHFFPEAEILIGDVFSAEGNKDLAIRQYEKALGMSKQLYVLNDKYRILYKLADIYSDENQHNYESTLKEIVYDDEMYLSAVQTQSGTQFITTLRNSGLDKLVILYRLKSYFSLEAHSMLGRLYFLQEDFESSTLHLIFSTVTVISRCIEELQFYDPDFIYTDGVELFERTARYSAVQAYIKKTELYENLYLLGKVMVELDSESDFVREVWETVMQFSTNNRLKNRIEADLLLLL